MSNNETRTNMAPQKESRVGSIASAQASDSATEQRVAMTAELYGPIDRWLR